MSLTKIQENTIESYAKWAMRSDNTARVMAPTEKYALRFAEKHDLSLPDLYQKLEVTKRTRRIPIFRFLGS